MINKNWLFIIIIKIEFKIIIYNIWVTRTLKNLIGKINILLSKRILMTELLLFRKKFKMNNINNSLEDRYLSMIMKQQKI